MSNNIFMLDIYSKIKGDIDTFLRSQGDIVETSNNDIISVKRFEAREELILKLESLLGQLPSILEDVNSSLVRAKASQAKEVELFNSLIHRGKKKKTTETYAGMVTGAKTTNVGSNSSNNIITPPVLTRTKIKITDNLSIPAISVFSFDQVKQDGNLYYVDSAEHFALKLSGKLFHGNIGTIYTDEKSPGKIKDCRFADSCAKAGHCDYYHNPMKFEGSHDHRNFIASSFLYTPPNSNYKMRPRSRRIGSREHLDTDIANLNDEEISKFDDQVMHDFLCALLINYACSPQGS